MSEKPMKEKEYYAHFQEGKPLEDHLKEVARMTRSFPKRKEVNQRHERGIQYFNGDFRENGDVDKAGYRRFSGQLSSPHIFGSKGY
jgi:hypothetical protein